MPPVSPPGRNILPVEVNRSVQGVLPLRQLELQHAPLNRESCFQAPTSVALHNGTTGIAHADRNNKARQSDQGSGSSAIGKEYGRSRARYNAEIPRLLATIDNAQALQCEFCWQIFDQKVDKATNTQGHMALR